MKKPTVKAGEVKAGQTKKKKNGDTLKEHMTFAEGLRRIAKAGKPRG